MKLVCTDCEATTTIPSAVYRGQQRVGGIFRCILKICTGSMKPAKPSRRGKSKDQKTSKAQEKRAARRIGGSVQPASGALSGAKGDVRKPFDTRMECKFTRKKSFALKLEELLKIEREASSGEKPVFEIEFLSNPTSHRYVVIPGWVYDQLTGDQNE